MVKNDLKSKEVKKNAKNLYFSIIQVQFKLITHITLSIFLHDYVLKVSSVVSKFEFPQNKTFFALHKPQPTRTLLFFTHIFSYRNDNLNRIVPSNFFAVTP